MQEMPKFQCRSNGTANAGKGEAAGGSARWEPASTCPPTRYRSRTPHRAGHQVVARSQRFNAWNHPSTAYLTNASPPSIWPPRAPSRAPPPGPIEQRTQLSPDTHHKLCAIKRPLRAHILHLCRCRMTPHRAISTRITSGHDQADRQKLRCASAVQS